MSWKTPGEAWAWTIRFLFVHYQHPPWSSVSIGKPPPKSTNEPFFVYVDGDLAGLIKHSASDRLGDLVLYGSSLDLSGFFFWGGGGGGTGLTTLAKKKKKMRRPRIMMSIGRCLIVWYRARSRTTGAQRRATEHDFRIRPALVIERIEQRSLYVMILGCLNFFGQGSRLLSWNIFYIF